MTMAYRFATAEKTVLPKSGRSVFFDGLVQRAAAAAARRRGDRPDGYVWCGSENGEVLRIAPDGSRSR